MVTTHLSRLLLHDGVAAMLEASHLDAYAPVLRFSRLAMEQNPEHLSNYNNAA